MNYTLVDISIGLDVSKKTISVYIPISKINLEIENSLLGFKMLFSKLKKLYKKEIDKLIFVYEPTGSYSELLKKFCVQKKINSFIINPKRSHNFAKAIGARNKTDKIDAKILSNSIVLAQKHEVIVPIVNEAVESIKELMSYYKFTVKHRVRANNHLESVKVKDGEKYVIKSLEKEIMHLKNKEAAIICEIQSIIFNDKELSQGYKNIQSITGIGKIGAMTLLHLFIKYPDANKRQLTSLAGLDPIEFQSGSSINKKAKISKAGSKLYRGTLFMGAMVASTQNAELKNFFERLKENGKHTTVAHIAVMRKMIIIAHSLYVNKEKYSSEKYKKHCGTNEN